MPTVKGGKGEKGEKHFPYTKAGVKAAKAYAKKSGGKLKSKKLKMEY